MVSIDGVDGVCPASPKGYAVTWVARLRPSGFAVAFSFRSLLRKENGGAEGDRTLDLSIANAALSQLSYGPTRGG